MSPGAQAETAEPARRILDPVERLSEVLFGLIMAMTFTGSISAATDGREEIRTMLFGAVGCNLAWGIVDAVMYLLTTLSLRGRGITTLHRIRGTKDPDEARRAIADALPPLVASLLRPSDYDHLHRKLLEARDVPARARLSVQDFRAALAVMTLVFASTFPLVIPFLLMQDAVRALRWSHAIAMTMLFLVGHALGRFSGNRGWPTGLAMVAIGLLLVAMTIALGG